MSVAVAIAVAEESFNHNFAAVTTNRPLPLLIDPGQQSLNCSVPQLSRNGFVWLFLIVFHRAVMYPGARVPPQFGLTHLLLRDFIAACTD